MLNSGTLSSRLYAAPLFRPWRCSRPEVSKQDLFRPDAVLAHTYPLIIHSWDRGPVTRDPGGVDRATGAQAGDQAAAAAGRGESLGTAATPSWTVAPPLALQTGRQPLTPTLAFEDSSSSYFSLGGR
ncbi:UNVERIFIED_CONTAM: hypothetical protein FKN15_062239 [Acipenser sinensis]